MIGPKEIVDVKEFVGLQHMGNSGNNCTWKYCKFPMEEQILGIGSLKAIVLITDTVV